MNEHIKVLVVDDEQVILDSARRILNADGHNVITAIDAETAVSVLQSEPLDLVITDLILPGMSGQKLLEEVHQQNPNLPVIITTGYSTVDHAVDALQKGALDFLPKPFTFEELLSPTRRAARYVRLPLSERTLAESSDAVGRYHLGSHTWVYMNDDGTALLGLSALLLKTVDRIVSMSFPKVDTRVRQGEALVRFTTADELVHRAWSPLSGRVLALNNRVQEDPDMPHVDTLKGGWLVKVAPTHLDLDMTRLKHSGPP
jgi:DNA-binding response OmpR family regulator